jgi:hypothetical protein
MGKVSERALYLGRASDFWQTSLVAVMLTNLLQSLLAPHYAHGTVHTAHADYPLDTPTATCG